MSITAGMVQWSGDAAHPINLRESRYGKRFVHTGFASDANCLVTAIDGAVHAFDLAIGPRVPHLGQAVVDAVFVADPVEDVVEGVFVPGVIGEMDAPSSLRTRLSVSTVWMV